MARRRSRISIMPLCKIGTLAHNRDFTPSEYEQYTGAPATQVQSLFRRGVLRRTGRGRYYPTARGWNIVERACSLVPIRLRRKR